MAQPEQVDKFYSDADKYWSEVPPTVDGMLGEYGFICNADIQGSMEFLMPLIQGENAKVGKHRACDCGAGIGRITKDLLLTFFDTVDLVELNSKFLDQARLDLKDRSVEKYICMGLQNFTPEPGRYDVIWCQWVLGHLTDSDLVAFFRRCQTGLAPGGVLVLKENVAFTENCDFDEQDSSFTRPQFILEKLIKEAGLTTVVRRKQGGFPQEIYAVWMYALQ